MQAVLKYTEEELITRLRSKDEKAFSYLYDNYASAIAGVINRMVSDAQITEDILQETFIKIWNNFHLYDSSKGRLYTWIINIGRNLAIDTLRSKAYKNQQKILADENVVSNIGDKNKAVEKLDTIGISKYVEVLNRDQKLIIDLAYFGGYTQEEISKEMGIPLGTVKTRMRTAIFQLRKLMSLK